MMTDSTPNLPISIEERLNQQRQALKNQLSAPPSNKIATKGKIFTLPDGTASAGPILAVVLDFAWAFVHYAGVYSSSNPQKPDCWALGRDKPESGLLTPDPSVAKPYAANCAVCAKNQWKSDNNGRGKACKNQRRLVIVAPDATLDTSPLTLYVSPGAIKAWDSYVNELDKVHGLLPIQVITEISFDENQTYPTLRFKHIDKHSNLELFYSLQTKAQEQLFRPVDSKAA